ncbi:MAG: glycosyltransferase [Alphaproteobacteria bacterium]|nr:glycosyltransferase [Alphaproteobacteria bacterium]
MTIGDTENERQEPRIAVVIMSYGPRASLANAVRSVQNQDAIAEIVVVHSGEGDAATLLRDAQIEVRVIHSDKRLLPGATRNAGIAATRAPIISFLADDCIAELGALRERLKAHDDGARAVSSALLCHQPRNPCALAAHLSLYARRMPRAAPALSLRYGASYARDLFDEIGLFREDMESGEDTEFHQRLSEADQPIWRPEVQTTHLGVDTFGDLLTSQFARGRRMARAWAAIGAYDKLAVARNAIARTSLVVRESLTVVPPEHRISARLAIPLIALGNIAYACGAWTWKETP